MGSEINGVGGGSGAQGLVQPDIQPRITENKVTVDGKGDSKATTPQENAITSSTVSGQALVGQVRNKFNPSPDSPSPLLSSSSSDLPLTERDPSLLIGQKKGGGSPTQGSTSALSLPKLVNEQSSWQECIQSDHMVLQSKKKVSDQDVEKVAKLCYEYAAIYPREVEAILHFNQNVRDLVIRYLCVGTQLNADSGTSTSSGISPNTKPDVSANASSDTRLPTKIDPEQQKALAQCFLQAGFPLLGQTLPKMDEYAQGVQDLIVKRREVQELYWQDHQSKHALDGNNLGRVATFVPGKPFFYIAAQYSLKNRNKGLSPEKQPSELQNDQNLAKTPDEEKPQEVFACRHLQEAAAGKTGLTTKQFLSAIAKGDVSQLKYQELEKVALEQNHTGLTINFSSEQFGALIRSMAIDMQEGESRSFMVNWAALPEGHAMRVFVEKTMPKESEKEDGKAKEVTVVREAGEVGAVGEAKEEGDEGGVGEIGEIREIEKEAQKDQKKQKVIREYDKISRIKVNLYEPNLTGNMSHIKVLPEDIAALSFNDFDKGRVHDIYNHDGVLALHVKDFGLVDRYAGTFVNADRSSQIASLGQAMSHNNLVETKKVLERLIGKNDPNGSTAAQNKDPLTPDEQKRLNDGIYLALQDGHTEPLKVFLEALPKLKDGLLDPTQITSLLEAKDHRNVPGLFMALLQGHVDIVSAFIEALPELKDFNLEPEQIKEIVEAKWDGAPGLFLALENGNADAVSAFLQALSVLNKGLELDSKQRLNPKQIKEILAAKRADGPPGLFMALQNGHAGAVKAFLEALPRLKELGVDFANELFLEQILEIVQAKRADGLPGLFMALQKGHARAVSAYLEALPRLKELGVDFEQKPISEKILEIVEAKNQIGLSGIYYSIVNNKGQAIEAYFKGLKTLGLKKDQIQSLFFTRAKLVIPDLVKSLERAQQATREAFYQGLKNLGLKDAWIQKYKDEV